MAAQDIWRKKKVAMQQTNRKISEKQKLSKDNSLAFNEVEVSICLIRTALYYTL